MKKLLALFALAMAFASASAVAQNTYSVYINSDNSAASGCTVALPGGTFSGADWRVQATLTPGAIPVITGVTLAPCSAGAFGAGTSIGGGTVELNTGVSGSDSVEFSAPGTGILNGSAQQLAFGFVAESPTGSDVLFIRNGGPIIFGITVPTPALGTGALLLLVLLLFGVAHRYGGKPLVRRVGVLSLFALCGIAVAAATFNWAGVGPIASDPAGDATNASSDVDLLAGYIVIDANTLNVRMDVADLQTQAPLITSGNATSFVVGQPGTFTVTATGVPAAALTLSGCVLPSGVNFVDNGNGSATLGGTPASGTANVYACTLTASNGVLPDATQSFTLTVANAASATVLSAGVNPSVFGQAVTFTATVTAASPPGPATPTGTVTFFDGATNIGSGALNGSGVATLSIATLAVASHPISAQYGGDTNYGSSTSASVNQLVNKAATTTAVVSSVNPSVFGQTVSLTVTIAAVAPGAGTPTGNVTFFDGAVNIGAVALAGGTATLTASALAVATHPITATYAGDASFVSSTSSPAVNQVVNAAATTTALVSDVSPSSYQQAVKFTATVTANAPGAGTPAGNVNFLDGAIVLGTVPLNASGVASLTTSTLAVATHSITATYAGNSNYGGSTSAALSQVVNKGSQTITFTSIPPANPVVGGASYAVAATATSGLAVTFTIDASAASVCSISGNAVSFLASGACVINANQAGDANFDPAPQAQQSFGVNKNNQTITFTSTAPAGAVVSGASYPVTATATSGLTVVLTIDASAASVCSISGVNVSFIGAGTCVIDANQAGDANWNAAPQVQQSFAVGKGNQTIGFDTTAPVTAAVGGATYAVAATATSGLPVVLTIDASAASVCSISANTVSFIGAGTCVIDANQPGDANWNAAPQVQQSFAVAKGNQTISFTSTAPPGAQFNGASYTVSATATSGLPVTFSIDGSATSVCSIAGTTVSFIGVGTCVINADQAGDSNYNPAPQAQQSFPVGKADQTISFTSTPPSPGFVNGNYTVSANASSGLTVTFSSGAPTVCAVAGSSVNFVGAGTCVIDANQAGDGNYNAAPQAQQSFIVNKNDQAIGFTSSAPADAKVGGPTYTVTATATSGLPVSFTIDPVSAGACTIVGSVVSFVHATTCVIDANQAGDAAYNPAPQMQQTFAIAKGDQAISGLSPAPAYGSATAAATPHTYTPTATTTSGLPIVVSIDGTSTAGACSAASPIVTFGANAGNCVINIAQPGDADWNAAPSLQQSTIVEIPATAVDESHAVTGNVAIAAATSVLSNDSGTSIAIRSYGALLGSEQTGIGSATATQQGGSVTLIAAGTYNYDPPANFTGTDSFKYVIGNDLSTTATGTVTLNVQDRIVVVASGASGNCKPVAPTACSLSTADGLAAATGKDLVFVQSGSYTNPNAAISLNANQTLVGNAVSLTTALTDAGITLAPESVALATIAAGATPSLSNSASVITLGGGNLVEYFTIMNSSGAAVAGTVSGSGTSNVHDVTVTNGANAGSGVNLAANLGTVNFSNLAVTTSSGGAFAASGGGTIAVTAGSLPNTLASTTGVALTVSNTTIGGAGLTFQSISANGASRGIVLNNTGTAAGNGGLTVTGVGSTAGSGGTIQNISVRGVEVVTSKALSLKNMNFTNANTTDGGTCDDLSTAACNAAIYLSGVSGVALDTIAVSGTTAQEGINGLNVNNFSLNNSTLTNCGAEVEEGCIKMRGLTGTSSITNSNLSFPGADVVEIVNSAGPVLTLTIDNSTFRDSQSSPVGNTGLQARSEGTASMVLNVTNSSFLRIRTVGLQATAIGSASNDVDVSTSTFDTGTGTMIGLDLDADNSGTLVFNVQNNPRIWSSNGPAINVFGDTNASINGRIDNNTDVRVLTHMGSNVGSAIRANINKDATAKLEVKNNTVNVGSDDAGIDLSAIGKTAANPGGATNTLDATVTNNNVTIGANSTYGMFLLAASNAGDTNALCANVGGNAITRNPSSIASFRARVPSVNGFFRMQNYTTNPEVTWNNNGDTPTSSGGSEVSYGGSGTFGSCTATLPTNPPLN